MLESSSLVFARKSASLPLLFFMVGRRKSIPYLGFKNTISCYILLQLPSPLGFPLESRKGWGLGKGEVRCQPFWLLICLALYINTLQSITPLDKSFHFTQSSLQQVFHFSFHLPLPDLLKIFTDHPVYIISTTSALLCNLSSNKGSLWILQFNCSASPVKWQGS